jgi:hypothetical protein
MTPDHKKHTLKKRYKPTLKAIFLRECFFSAKKTTAIFLQIYFLPPHRFTANLHQHCIECKSLLITFVRTSNSIAADGQQSSS